mgnify:CR=1 FL=1
MEMVERDIFYYIEIFYNRRRLHSSLGYLCNSYHNCGYLVSSNDYAKLQNAVLCNSSLDGSKQVQTDINLDSSVDGIDAIQHCHMNNGA